MLLSGKSLLVLLDGTIKLVSSLEEAQELRKGTRAVLYALNVAAQFGYNKAEYYPTTTTEAPLKAIPVLEEDLTPSPPKEPSVEPPKEPITETTKEPKKRGPKKKH